MHAARVSREQSVFAFALADVFSVRRVAIQDLNRLVNFHSFTWDDKIWYHTRGPRYEVHVQLSRFTLTQPRTRVSSAPTMCIYARAVYRGLIRSYQYVSLCDTHFTCRSEAIFCSSCTHGPGNTRCDNEKSPLDNVTSLREFWIIFHFYPLRHWYLCVWYDCVRNEWFCWSIYKKI